MFKVKIHPKDITHGPQVFELDELTAMLYAHDLTMQGYRRTSNAYCLLSRIDREDWLEVLARSMNTCVAHFYNLNGSGVSDRWRDHYIRSFSKDKITVSPAIHRKVPGY